MMQQHKHGEYFDSLPSLFRPLNMGAVERGKGYILPRPPIYSNDVGQTSRREKHMIDLSTGSKHDVPSGIPLTSTATFY